MQFSLDAENNPVEVRTLRQSEAKPEHVHRPATLRRRMPGMARHQGFLIPERVELDNICGRPDRTPFLISTNTRAEF